MATGIIVIGSDSELINIFHIEIKSCIEFLNLQSTMVLQHLAPKLQFEVVHFTDLGFNLE
ncbi:MAG TPA: hypothetical protein DEF07_03860 [Nitrosomonas sp.]|nr:MAG: hypothetical protein NMNS02_04670 [Nitrosomonas sp.]HBV20841.1 hypothetical protein [Nitrosomonas sp.]